METMLQIIICMCLFIVTTVDCQSTVLFCEAFTVSGATDATFNGKYEISDLTASRAPEKEVYSKKDGSKIIFWKAGVMWGIGPRTSLQTGQDNYRGALAATSGAASTWSGRGRARATVTNSSRICSEDFSAAEDEEYFGDLTEMSPGTNNCRGALAIYHGVAGNAVSDAQIRVFQPSAFRNTRRIFRTREITKVEVMGNCHWRLYPQTRFRGRFVRLEPGFNTFVNINPKSISQRQ